MNLKLLRSKEKRSKEEVTTKLLMNNHTCGILSAIEKSYGAFQNNILRVPNQVRPSKIIGVSAVSFGKYFAKTVAISNMNVAKKGLTKVNN